jgi:hypothetical protein
MEGLKLIEIIGATTCLPWKESGENHSHNTFWSGLWTWEGADSAFPFHIDGRRYESHVV